MIIIIIGGIVITVTIKVLDTICWSSYGATGRRSAVIEPK